MGTKQAFAELFAAIPQMAAKQDQGAMAAVWYGRLKEKYRDHVICSGLRLLTETWSAKRGVPSLADAIECCEKKKRDDEAHVEHGHIRQLDQAEKARREASQYRAGFHPTTFDDFRTFPHSEPGMLKWIEEADREPIKVERILFAYLKMYGHPSTREKEARYRAKRVKLIRRLFNGQPIDAREFALMEDPLYVGNEDPTREISAWFEGKESA